MTIKYLDSKRIEAISTITRYTYSYDLGITGLIDFNYGAPNYGFPMTGSHTIGMWLHLPLDATAYTDHCFVTSTTNGHYMYADANNVIGYYDSGGGGGFRSSGFDLDTLSGWHYVALTSDHSATETKIYVDGVQVGSTIGSVKTNGVAMNQVGASSQSFGKLGGLAIWNTVLTASELLSIFNDTNPNSVQTNNLLLLWTLQETSGTTAINSATGTASLGTGSAPSGDGVLGSGYSIGQTGVNFPVTKPTNVQDNSILVEKDTANRYWFSEALAPTFEDDFDYATQSLADTAWVTINTAKARVNITTDKLDFDFQVSTTKAGISHAISSISDEKWIMRWKHNYTTSASVSAYNYWVLSDSNTADVSVAKDSLGVVVSDDAVYLHVRNNQTSISSGGTGVSATMATGIDYYFEVKRTSTTSAEFTIRTGSHEGTVHATVSVTNVPATLSGLTYFVGYNRNNENGSGRIAGTLDDFEFYNGVTSATPATWTWSNDKTRGVFGGGSTTGDVNTMDYIIIATLGNAVDFGDLTVARRALDGVSSDVRGVFGGGENGSRLNVMDYITIATAGNATDFGDLTVARRNVGGVSSDAGRGVFGGGYGSTYENTMDYITIATTGNATDFGNLTVARTSPSGCNSDVRGVISGGNGSNVMDYITIATTGNATDFGDLSTASGATASVDSDVRGVIQNGNANNVIDYITIATAGNATDFGDSLQVSHGQAAGVSGTTRGVFGGGYNTSNVSQNYIEYVTIATLGNAIDFGDLSQARAVLAGVQS
tara:strand:- start:28 stop:2343 length:2316 start_codon:yes stop_codon:yes gene_type:complete